MSNDKARPHQAKGVTDHGRRARPGDHAATRALGGPARKPSFETKGGGIARAAEVRLQAAIRRARKSSG